MKQKAGKTFCAASSAALAIALIAAGCGGSGESAPLKKPQFVTQANSICRNAEAERDTALREAASSNPEVAALATETALPPIQKMTEELGELGPPVGHEKEVGAIIGAFEKGIKSVEANPSDVASDVSAFTRANELAEEYGLTDCQI
jgi:hypothetical protein